MKLRFDVRALEDLRNIRNYIRQHGGAQSAELVQKHSRARVNRLRTHPLIGIQSDLPDIRILPPTRYPCRIYYSVQGDTVVILHLRHTARRVPELGEIAG